MTATRRRRSRIRIALLAMVLLLQSLAAVLPASATASMHRHAVADATSSRPPCDRMEMAGQAVPPCCDDEGGSPPCGDPGQCGGDCGMLRTAALLPMAWFDAPAVRHQAQVPGARVVDLRPRPVSPGLRPPIFA